MSFSPCRKYAISGIVPFLVLSLSAIAHADPIFPAKRQIGISQAMGVSGVTSVVSLSPRQSLNISFIKTGEIIKKVWLGNPSKVVMDYDSPLCKDGTNDSNCGATVINLRQLAQPIDLDMNLPASARGNRTSLTVITTGAGGLRNLYQFQLVLNVPTPAYSILEVVPDAQIPRLIPLKPIVPAQTNKTSMDS
ncbi:hypothetical protein H6F42_20230 [Pseudanabaena sp. FACHB-1998]|uniref:hypothetical protein n=1 Tax=Pseudanabaena sp. FACHB-1998 TaxID=2692858 RepID=UPI001680F313|nr:hypothetical protein [Pseudanabaena sp. FACHB-1998]MBD2179255.1 hypothetical protein [Pseudanabaena sp. FACHB-1998]